MADIIYFSQKTEPCVAAGRGLPTFQDDTTEAEAREVLLFFREISTEPCKRAQTGHKFVQDTSYTAQRKQVASGKSYAVKLANCIETAHKKLWSTQLHLKMEDQQKEPSFQVG